MGFYCILKLLSTNFEFSADLPTVEVEDNQVSFKVMTQSASRVEPVVTAMVHQQEQKAPPPTRKHSPVRVIPREAKRKSPVRTTAREELKAKPVRPGIQTESEFSWVFLMYIYIYIYNYKYSDL